MAQQKRGAAPGNGFSGDWNPMEDDYESKYFNTYKDPMKDWEQGKSVDMYQKHSPSRNSVGISPTKVDSDVVNLYVGNVPIHLTKDGLSNLFARAGNVMSARVCQPKVPGGDRTFGFVTFGTVREAEEAIKQLHGKELVSGMPLRVNLSHGSSDDGGRNRSPLGFASNGQSSQTGLPQASFTSRSPSPGVSRPDPVVNGFPAPATPSPGRPTDDPDKGSCSYCGVFGTLKRCAACKMPYCGSRCQREDWGQHKATCSFVSPRSAAARAAPGKGNAGLDDFESRFEIDIDDPKQAMEEIFGASPIGKQACNANAMQDNASRQPSLASASKPKRVSAVNVLVGCIDGDGILFVNVADVDSATALMDITTRLTKDAHTSTLAPLATSSCRVGCKVAVEYEGEWSRALVTDVAGEDAKRTVDIFYMDYGNDETRPASELFALPEYAANLTAQAERFHLHEFPTARSSGEKEQLQVIASEVLIGRLLRLEPLPGLQDDAVKLQDEDGNDCCEVVRKGFEKYQREHSAPEASTVPQPDPPVPAKTTVRPSYVTMLSSKVPLEALPKDTAQFAIVLLHVVSPQLIQFQIVSKGGENVVKTTQLMQDLVAAYAGSEYDGFRPACGELCIGLFDEDQSWYRVSVLSYADDDGGTAHVRYVDYGNTAHVPVSNLRPIEARFTELRRQAATCCLQRKPADKEIAARLVNFLNSHALSEIHQVKLIDNRFGKALIEFVDADMSDAVGRILRNEQVAAPTAAQPPCDTGPVEPVPIPPIQHEQVAVTVPPAPVVQIVVPDAAVPADRFPVVITHVESPFEFYGQSADRKTLVLGDEISIDLQSRLANRHPPSESALCLGYYCAALCSDGQWYRACVTALSGAASSVTVQYVDFGNSEVVLRSNLRTLDAEDTKVPALAIPMKLDKLVPVNNLPLWSADACAKFSEIIVSQLCYVGGVSTVGPLPCAVRLCLGGDETGADVSKQLRMLGLAVEQELTAATLATGHCAPGGAGDTKLAPAQWLESYNELTSGKAYLQRACVEVTQGSRRIVHVGDVVDPHLFYARFAGSGSDDQLSSLSSNVAASADGAARVDATRVAVGEMYCVRDDDRFCRCIVENISGDTEKVRLRLVDYGVGRVVPTSELIALRDALKQVEFLSFPCSLHCLRSIVGDDRWTEDCCERVRCLLPSNGKPIKAIVIGTSDERVILSPVVQHDDSDRVADVLVREGYATYASL